VNKKKERDRSTLKDYVHAQAFFCETQLKKIRSKEFYMNLGTGIAL